MGIDSIQQSSHPVECVKGGLILARYPLRLEARISDNDTSCSLVILGDIHLDSLAIDIILVDNTCSDADYTSVEVELRPSILKRFGVSEQTVGDSVVGDH